MKFRDLPEAVQIVAANVLAAKIHQHDLSGFVKPAPGELAAGVRDAFCELYSEVKGAAFISTVCAGDVGAKIRAGKESIPSQALQDQIKECLSAQSNDEVNGFFISPEVYCSFEPRGLFRLTPQPLQNQIR